MIIKEIEITNPRNKDFYNKYKNKKTEIDNHVFSSQKEAQRYKELLLLQNTKKITGLTLQPKFNLIPAYKDKFTNKMVKPIVYIADFLYTEADTKRTVVEDVKGFKTDVYKLKSKMFRFFMQDKIEFRET